MAIPESRLSTWSRQGAVTTAKQTHESIRAALNQYDRWPDRVDYEVYLQGSYKNDTNIRGDSDVDVVVQLNSAFCSNLSEDWKRYFGWKEFRADVLQALRSYYGSNRIREGRKSLKVSTSYLPADVVVCIQYRRYPSHPRSANDFVEGMCFWVPSESRWVINYPKLHHENGVSKNRTTDEQYKPSVRLFKNARTYLVDRGVIPSDLAPSYFLECLLYNVPNHCYKGTFQEIFCAVVNYLQKADLSQFVCQNGQHALFGNSPEQWSQDRANRFIQSIVRLWNDWG